MKHRIRVLPTRLKHCLHSANSLVRLVGAHNALGAVLIEQSGFDGVWASSLEIATSLCQKDDDHLILTDVLSASSRMASCCHLPVVVDCGTGGDLAEDVADLVCAFERAGVAGVCLEDGGRPKRNSLLPGEHDLMPADQFAKKIETARRACYDPDFVLIARVEALIAHAGMGEALDRARRYAAAGADAILIHSRSDTPDEIFAFVELWDEPVPLVVIPTSYPAITVDDLRRTGKVRMVIYANQGMRAAIRAVNQVLRSIRQQGTAEHVETRIASLAEVFALQAGFAREDDWAQLPVCASFLNSFLDRELR